MTTNNIWWLSPLVLASLLQGCATSNDAVLAKDICGPEFTPSSLLASGMECDGRRVLVRGFIREGFEMHGLWDTIDDINSGNFMEACITTYNPNKLKLTGPVRQVNAIGIYRSQRPSRLVILGDCTDEVLEIERVTRISK